MQGDMQGRHCTTIEWKTETHNDVNRQCQPLTCCSRSTASCHEAGQGSKPQVTASPWGGRRPDVLPPDTPATSDALLLGDAAGATRLPCCRCCATESVSCESLLQRAATPDGQLPSSLSPPFSSRRALETITGIESYGNIGPVLPPPMASSSTPISPLLSSCIKFNVSTRKGCVWAVVMMARDCSSSFSALTPEREPSDCTNKQRCYVPICAYQRMYVASNKDHAYPDAMSLARTYSNA
ncbi:hypothetical protein V8C26DRAFT_349495 [Trichoderma gracile]